MWNGTWTTRVTTLRMRRPPIVICGTIVVVSGNVPTVAPTRRPYDSRLCCSTTNGSITMPAAPESSKKSYAPRPTITRTTASPLTNRTGSRTAVSRAGNSTTRRDGGMSTSLTSGVVSSTRLARICSRSLPSESVVRTRDGSGTPSTAR